MAVAWNLDFARHVTPESDFLRLIISLYGSFPSVPGWGAGVMATANELFAIAKWLTSLMVSRDKMFGRLPIPLLTGGHPRGYNGRDRLEAIAENPYRLIY